MQCPVYIQAWSCSWRWLGFPIWLFLKYAWQGGIIKLRNGIASSQRAENSFCDNYLARVCLLFVRSKDSVKLGNQARTSWGRSRSRKPLSLKTPMDRKRDNAMGQGPIVLIIPFIIPSTLFLGYYCRNRTVIPKAQATRDIPHLFVQINFPEESRTLKLQSSIHILSLWTCPWT